MPYKRHAALALTSLVLVAFLCPGLLPLANALPQQSQYGVKVLSVGVSGNTGNAEIQVNGVVYDFNATISTSTNGDPTVYVGASYASYPVYIGNPPYAGWWNGISNPPCIYIYLDPNTAANTQNALGGMAALFAFLSAVPGVNIGVIITAGIVGLFAVDYTTIYQEDHSPNGSFSMWMPIDWYNVFLLETSHDFYVATPESWWIVLPFIALKSGGR